MKPLLDSHALVQAIRETSGMDGPGVLWLRDLYRSQRLCSVCGKPFFAHNARSTICGNTCVQRRKRGTEKDGDWWRRYAKTRDQWFPTTIAELEMSPLLERVRAHLPFEVLSSGGRG